MIYVCIDTTVLRSDPSLRGAAFQALVELCACREVALVLSEVVRKEFESSLKDEIEETISRAMNHLNSVIRKGIEPEVAREIQSVVANLDKLKLTLEESLVRNWDQFAILSKAKLIPIDATHGEAVMNAYFSGSAPFSRAKHRNDIPDAFIYMVANDSATKYGALHFISNDDNLRTKVSIINSVVCYKTLGDFLESPTVARLQEKLFDYRFAQLIKLHINEHIDYLDLQTRQYLPNALSSSKVTDDSIPDDNNEANVGFVTDIEFIEFDFDKINRYSSTVFSLPFEAKIASDLYYYVFKADYYALPENKVDHIVIEDWNDHYYEATENYELRVHGAISLQFETADINDESLFDNMEIKIDRINDIEVIGK